jgi:hypothetical protein
VKLKGLRASDFYDIFQWLANEKGILSERGALRTKDCLKQFIDKLNFKDAMSSNLRILHCFFQ